MEEVVNKLQWKKSLSTAAMEEVEGSSWPVAIEEVDDQPQWKI